ncbi:MAG: MotA/TolQ/ExbB proton channel family protein [Chrysiogenetes bacterium]|nr:MotA/TolQ/ExbB proton channel family protein [Chrysiogenetes bacterium]
MGDWTTQDWIFYGALLPIALCSSVAMAFFFERLLALRRTKIFPEQFLVEFDDLLGRGAYEEAGTLCRKTDTPLSRVLLAATAHAGLPRAALKERIEEVGRRESVFLERGVAALATVGTISPMLGLLGTVVGMVLIFAQATGGAGIAAPEQLASGISTALYTTVLGLLVAIPSIISARYFQGKAESVALEIEIEAFRVMDQLCAEAQG